jgi:hypothetical protein
MAGYKQHSPIEGKEKTSKRNPAKKILLKSMLPHLPNDEK